MQNLSSQSTTGLPPTSKKAPIFFENPLTRPEIGTPEGHPLVQPAISHVSDSQAKNPQQSPMREETPLRSVMSKEALYDKAQNNDLPSAAARRKLPEEIKEIFENNSKNFAAYGKNDTNNPLSRNEKMDEWDRALLLGEDSLSVPDDEQSKPKKLVVPAVVVPTIIPKKSDVQTVGTAFPSRVMDEEIVSPVFHAEVPKTPPSVPVKPKMPVIPKKPPIETVVKTNIVSRSAVVPMKPKQPTTENAHPPTPAPIETKISQVPTKPVVPQVPKKQETKNPLSLSPNMSETLVEKIIEGQMRGVFENAPPLLQKELEKTTVSEIMAADDQKPRGSIENEVWKKRLREYITKLHNQAQSVFSDANMVNPVEGELVLDYVKRIYPVLLKAQVTKQ